ncbi:MAG TPA: hypothetical protein VI455_13790 [Terriglobia bacterium]
MSLAGVRPARESEDPTGQTSGPAVPPEDKLAALERILRSKAFSNAEAIRHLLKFIADQSVSDSDEEIKEYTIAVEALGRPQDFDPKVDNIVRVQMRRVRQKLDEYYRLEGAGDPVRVSIPRGHYHVEWSLRSAKPTHGSPKAGSNEDEGALARWRFRSPLAWKILAIALLLFNLALGVSSLLRREASGVPRNREKDPISPALASVWQPFIDSRQQPLVIYSNALFLMSQEGDLYRYSLDGAHFLPFGARVQSFAGLERRGPAPPVKGPMSYSDAYTGTGEVVAAARIAELFSRAGRDFAVKRDGVVSFEDIRNNNVVFLGASLEDTVLAQLPLQSDLGFEQTSQPAFSGSQVIRDRHPAPGHPSLYALGREPKTQAIAVDYALISLLPGVTPNHFILVLGGLSTIGTQAAAEFATSEESLQPVARMRAEAAGSRPLSPYFQALLAVQIRDGVAAKTDCLLTREVRHNGPGALASSP